MNFDDSLPRVNNQCSEHVLTYKASTAAEFLTALDPAHPAWGLDAKSLYGNRWAFRGHADASWQLLPSAWRPDSIPRLSRFVPANMFDGVAYAKAWNDRFHSFTAVEHEIVRQFVRLADEVGHPVPESHKIPPDSRIHDMMTYQGDIAFNQWWKPSAAYALAQHHGVPTRLLDFTMNPITAAFFAARQAEVLIRTGFAGSHISVWACNIHKLPSYDESERIRDYYPIACYQPLRSEIAFLHAQSGCFLYVPCACANNYFQTCHRWPSLLNAIEEYCHDNPNDKDSYNEMFIQVLLPIGEVQSLLDALWLRRVSLAHLMPTYDNVKETLFEFVERLS